MNSTHHATFALIARYRERGTDGELIAYERAVSVTVNADLLTIARNLVNRAYRSKRKRATMGGGTILVTVR